MKLKRFEYYDSLRGGPGMVLDNLRQWLQVRRASASARVYAGGRGKHRAAV